MPKDPSHRTTREQMFDKGHRARGQARRPRLPDGYWLRAYLRQRLPYLPNIADEFIEHIADTHGFLEKGWAGGTVPFFLIKDRAYAISFAHAARVTMRKHPGHLFPKMRIFLCIEEVRRQTRDGDDPHGDLMAFFNYRHETEYLPEGGVRAGPPFYRNREDDWPLITFLDVDPDDYAHIPQGRLRSFDHAWTLFQLNFLRALARKNSWDQAIPDDPAEARRVAEEQARWRCPNLIGNSQTAKYAVTVETVFPKR